MTGKLYSFEGTETAERRAIAIRRLQFEAN
jgi:hypothetical protein